MWTLDRLAVGWARVRVVKATEPERAGVSREGPLTDPDLVAIVAKVLRIAGRTLLVHATRFGDSLRPRMRKSNVVVVVDRHQIAITRREKVAPHVPMRLERVMENKVRVRRILLHEPPDVPIELLQDSQI